MRWVLEKVESKVLQGLESQRTDQKGVKTEVISSSLWKERDGVRGGKAF